MTMDKTIITVVGKDAVGIIARICTFLSGHEVNILEITQTIVDGYFNMMMIVDTTGLNMDYAEFSRSIDALGDDIGVSIRCQKSEIFDKMHRI